jgi:hypothetical protein
MPGELLVQLRGIASSDSGEMGLQGFAFVAKGIGRPLPRHVTIPVKSGCRQL